MSRKTEDHPEFVFDKSLMVDSMGKYLTQSLFLEVGYNPQAVFTFKDQDHMWEGKIHYSMKRLYLQMQDPTEYQFATTILCGWRHWQRMLENKLIRKHIDEWREELEFKLRAEAVAQMLASATAGNYQATKWLADRGWAQRAAGRPSKSEIDGEKAFQARLGDEYGKDVLRLLPRQGTS